MNLNEIKFLCTFAFPQKNSQKMDDQQGVVDLLGVLSEPDAIFMPNATDTLTKFLKDKDNKPEDAIRALTSGFRGYAEMCNLLASWAEDAGCSVEEIAGVMVKTVSDRVKAVYDPQCTRNVFQTRSRNIPWMNFMVTKPLWRSVLYELAEIHKADAVLGLALSTIEEVRIFFFKKKKKKKKRAELWNLAVV
jgi:hypothetical protein